MPLNEDYLHKIERYRILSSENNDQFHPSFKPYLRSKSLEYLKTIEGSSKADEFNLAYLVQDSWEYSGKDSKESRRSVLDRFYKTPSDFFYVQEPNFHLQINPVFHFEAGNESGGDELNYINTRGVQVRGMIDDKIGFYSYIGENQMKVPAYVDRYISSISAVPHEGFWKNFKTTGYDFFTVRGYMSIQATKSMNLQFGYDRHKIGHGIRSMMLSDFAPPNLYFRLQANLWKFNYTQLITQLTQDNIKLPSGRYPEKYMALHHLSLNLGKKVNIGLFEAIMSGGSEYGGFQLALLNPVIFYRAIEQQSGSSDNAIVGLDAEWLVTKGISIYGQLALDEFLLANVREGNGWWANKAGVQLGMNYINVAGIDNLDLKVEMNRARPYTYSHYTPYGSYSHYRQSLAHPLGANFKEIVGELRYQPIERLEIIARLMSAQLGRDGNNENWGGDILKDYATREMDFGNETTQGVLSKITYSSVRATYMLRHNLFVDGQYIIRNEDSDDDALDLNLQILSLGLRLNIAGRNHEF